MSSVDYNYHSSTNSSLVSKILEQGQRLRNSMVHTILSNDPFNKEVIGNSLKGDSRVGVDRERRRRIRHCCKLKSDDNLTGSDEFNEEKALQELGIKFDDNFVKPFFKSCSCNICREYNKFVSHSQLPTETIQNIEKNPSYFEKEPTQRKPESLSKLKTIKNTFDENQSLLKYVDSLKVEIHYLKLNVAGKRKIESNNSEKFSFANSTTYFIEYSLPEILIRNVPKSKAKVNSGLHPKNKIRYCSKKFQNNNIWFKNHHIHSISNIELLDLSSINVEVIVSCRSMKQRAPVFFGKCYFNLGSILISPLLNIDQDLSIVGERAPVVLGHMRVTLQLGCDKLHFGKEFIDAILCRKTPTELPSTESVHKVVETDYNITYATQKNIPSTHINENVLTGRSTYESLPEKQNISKINENIQTSLLYGYVQISEAQLLGGPMNSYLVCYGLHRDDIVNSPVIYNSFNPVFNFYQLIPLLYDENFLKELQDRYVLIEVWEKRQEEDQLIGITKLSLHRFFVIYRNPQVVAHLFKNQNPVIGIDWWEPIIHPVTRKNCGQLKSLVAIGTETQINSLKQNLEFKYLTNRNNLRSDLPVSQSDRYYQKEKPVKETHDNSVDNIVYDKYVQTPEIEVIPSGVNENFATVDASTQSEINMDAENFKAISGRDFLNSFIEQVIASKDTAQKNVYVENSTNTDEISNEKLSTEQSEPKDVIINKEITGDCSTNSNVAVKNTSDLLESLQKALAFGNNSDNKTNLDNTLNFDNLDNFKVHIVIDSALHLPSRRKCKSKRNKMKGAKHNEEILPSTYVTFKNESNADMIVTNVVAKSTSPHWDFRCDTQLPADLLLNNTKRLIFKVWRRSSATSLQPNFQTDVVLGFAALDLTVLLSGLPTVQGWFNIVDFSSKCNGQIKIHVTPLENLSKYNKYKIVCTPEKPKISYNPVPMQGADLDESSPELFNRALKRKFTELEEITQRLKQRLSTITNDDSDMSDEFADEFERDLNTECVETEKVSFENVLYNLNAEKDRLGMNEDNLEMNEENVRLDMNEDTVINEDLILETHVNDDANVMLDLSEERIKKNSLILDMINDNCKEDNTRKEDKTSKLDQHLLEGKLKIDSLLEKLSLITENQKADQRIDSLLEKLTLITENDSDKSFSNRYVSGCSIDQETSDSTKSLNNNPLLKQLSEPNLDPDLIFNPLLFQQLFSGSNEATPRSDEFKTTTLQSLIDSTSSSTSVDSFTETNVSRQAPDGAGISEAQLK